MWVGYGTCAAEASGLSVGLRVSGDECWQNCTKRVRRVGKGELGRKRTRTQNGRNRAGEPSCGNLNSFVIWILILL